MKKIIYSLVIALSALYNVNAQLPSAAPEAKTTTINISSKPIVTYYSVADGNWDDAATWSFIRGGIGGSGVPGASDNVVICYSNDVNVNVNSACNNLTIQVTGSLTCTYNNFTVNGTTDIFGVFTDKNDKGTNTFIGPIYIYIGGLWNTTAVITDSRLIFQNGITHYGSSFQAGAATFKMNDQNLAGGSIMTFAGDITISGGITVNNQNTSNITINGALDGIAGNTWNNKATSTLYYGNASAPMANGALTVRAKSIEWSADNQKYRIL